MSQVKQLVVVVKQVRQLVSQILEVVFKYIPESHEIQFFVVPEQVKQLESQVD